MTAAQAIELRGDPPAEIAAAIAQVDRLNTTIDTLLALRRDAGQDGAVTDLGPLLDNVEARWRGRLAAAGRPLQVRREMANARARASGPVVSEDGHGEFGHPWILPPPRDAARSGWRSPGAPAGTSGRVAEHGGP